MGLLAMRRVGSLGALLVMVFASVGCNETVAPIRPPSALLRCNQSAECTRFDQAAQCGAAGLCEMPFSGIPTDAMLVVDIPESSYAGAGSTLLLPRSEWRFAKSASCNNEHCLRLPRVVRARTRFVVGDEAATLLPELASERGALLGSDVSYVPRIRLVRDGKSYTYDADAIGLPVAPPRSVPLVPKTQGLRGVWGTKPTDALAYLATNGLYSRRVTPAVWLSRSVPPLQDVIVDPSALDDDGVATLVLGSPETPLDVPSLFSLRYDPSWSGGVHVWMRDAVTHSRLSSDADLPPCLSGTCEVSVALRSAGGLVAGSLLSEILFEPRASQNGLHVDHRVNATLGSIAPIVLPALPALSSVMVSAIDRQGADVPGRVFFKSVDSTAAFSMVSVQSEMVLSDALVQLPSGQYRWTLRPDDGVHGAISGVLSLRPSTVPSPALVIEVPRKRRVQGRVVDPAGAPLSGASVGVEVVSSEDHTAQWSTDVTAPDGSFHLLLDPGSYALRVRAQDWTSLGEARLRRVDMMSQDVDLGVLRMGVPWRASFQLFDADELSVSRAGMIVRMYNRADRGSSIYFESVALARTNDVGAATLQWSELTASAR